MDTNINKKKAPNRKFKLYRLTIFEDAIHKNLFSVKFNKINLIVIIFFSIILIMSGVFFLVAYTPLKQFVPGYPSPQERKIAIENIHKIDSLEKKIDLWSFQIANIHRILTGKEAIHIDSLTTLQSQNAPIANDGMSSIADSLLRKEITDREKFIISSNKEVKIDQIEGLLFFPPVKGVITGGYNKAESHPYIDIAVPENTIVSSTLAGSVIYSGWNDDTGYTIQIQHDKNLISIYKHNIKLLKNVGEKVEAGTPVSIVGDTGSLSTGSHLHFELWHNGEPIDPTKYISF